MATWKKGADRVREQLATGQLQRVTGGQAQGKGWLIDANKKLSTAEAITDADPESSFILVAESAHCMGLGVLAHQGLRPTVRGGHLAIQHTLEAQFDPAFSAYDWIRRRRHETKYPAFPGEQVSQTELTQAINDVAQMISGAEKLLDQLGIFQ